MSVLTNIKSNIISREFGNQSYRSSLSYQKQARTGTEKAKDDLISGSNPESEMVRPYADNYGGGGSGNYGEMEYYVEPPSGLSALPGVDGVPVIPATDEFEDFWADKGFFFTANDKAFVTANDKIFEQS